MNIKAKMVCQEYYSRIKCNSSRTEHDHTLVGLSRFYCTSLIIPVLYNDIHFYEWVNGLEMVFSKTSSIQTLYFF